LRVGENDPERRRMDHEYARARTEHGIGRREKNRKRREGELRGKTGRASSIGR
jgi:hypothetical protein